MRATAEFGGIREVSSQLAGEKEPEKRLTRQSLL